MLSSPDMRATIGEKELLGPDLVGDAIVGARSLSDSQGVSMVALL